MLDSAIDRRASIKGLVSKPFQDGAGGGGILRSTSFSRNSRNSQIREAMRKANQLSLNNVSSRLLCVSEGRDDGMNRNGDLEDFLMSASLPLTKEAVDEYEEVENKSVGQEAKKAKKRFNFLKRRNS